MMTALPTTPPSDDAEEEPSAPIIDFSPQTIPYDEVFENALMASILYPNPSKRLPQPSSMPPFIPPSTLPIALSSPLRTHPSPLPSILLTHPNGYITGGPGPTGERVAEYVKGFVGERGIEGREELERKVSERREEVVGDLRERMRRREEAVRRNEGVRKRLVDLEVQRSAEVRVQERIRMERERRRG